MYACCRFLNNFLLFFLCYTLNNSWDVIVSLGITVLTNIILFLYIVITSQSKTVSHFILTIKNYLSIRMICTKFGWISLSGFRENVNNKKVQTDGVTYSRTDRRAENRWSNQTEWRWTKDNYETSLKIRFRWVKCTNCLRVYRCLPLYLSFLRHFSFALPGELAFSSLCDCYKFREQK